MTKLTRHGTEAGYRAEIEQGNVCTRCRNAHSAYNKQFTKSGKAAGMKYRRDQVIDHLNTAGTFRGNLASVGDFTVSAQKNTMGRQDVIPEMPAANREGSVTSRLSDALGERLRGFTAPTEPPDPAYVSEDDTDGLTSVEPDPEPSGDDWARVTDEEFIVNAAGLKKIEDSLGTYLSIAGMTVEMIDPYCGPILAQNLTIMVERWSRVIAQYPTVAKIFLDGKGGVLMLWITALQATWPVLYAIYEHHLGKTVRTHDGIIERKVPGNNAFRGFDATMPPMAESFNYSTD